MARTLKDVYIKVTKHNRSLLEDILHINIDFTDVYILFKSDCIENSYVSIADRLDKHKVNLSELKRLIETIPTREEITQLKRQVSAYKTNYERLKSELHDDNMYLNEIILSKAKDNSLLIDKISSLEYEKEISIKREHENISKFTHVCKQLQDENNSLKFEIERLKNKKWWQIWK